MELLRQPTDLDKNHVILERLKATNSSICKELIKYCDENMLPIPEVGAELLDENGAVVYEGLELCWEPDRIGVVLTDEDLEYATSLTSGWKFAVASELDAMKCWLDEVLSVSEEPLEVEYT